MSNRLFLYKTTLVIKGSCYLTEISFRDTDKVYTLKDCDFFLDCMECRLAGKREYAPSKFCLIITIESRD